MAVYIDPESIVEEYKIGNTTIKIADTYYKDKTDEDIDKILKRICKIGRRRYTQANNEEGDTKRT